MPPELNLSDLATERPGLTAERGGGFAQAAAVCFEINDHRAGVLMPVDGMTTEDFEVGWPIVTDAVRRTWGDPQEAAEHGAYGVAVLLAERLVGLTVVERSFKYTGFDYWLGTPSSGVLFQNRTKLEVSGIYRGESTIDARVRQKLSQIAKFDSQGTTPAYVAVVDFRQPAARWVRR